MGADALEESSPLIRAFFALPLPEAQRASLGRHLTECAARAPAFRWVAVENLHLTMRFIGMVDLALVQGIGERLAAQRLASPRLELGERGTFKRGRLVRVVWVGLGGGADTAAALAAAVEAECAIAGLEKESRPFTPHLTLARSRERDGAPLPELPTMPKLEPWTASELILYQSHLSPKGATYEPVVRLRLGGSG